MNFEDAKQIAKYASYEYKIEDLGAAVKRIEDRLNAPAKDCVRVRIAVAVDDEGISKSCTVTARRSDGAARNIVHGTDDVAFAFVEVDIPRFPVVKALSMGD